MIHHQSDPVLPKARRNKWYHRGKRGGKKHRNHNLDFHVYADYAQVHISFNPKEPNPAMEALQKLELCIMDLKNWMKTNKLMLNNNKTEFFIAGCRQSIQRLPPIQLQVGDSTIMPSCHIWNLGVMFDTRMTMSKQVSAIVSSANYQRRNLWRLHRYLDQETRHQVVRALILSRLDYDNALLYGTTSKELKRIQSIQNKAAKFIFSASRRDSPAPLLHLLHWLPVRERIFFKLCLYVYKSLNGHAPQYLTESLKVKSRPQGPVTRSASDNTLLINPPTRTHSGDKAFAVRGPSIWNTIPGHIHDSPNTWQFQKGLENVSLPISVIFSCFVSLVVGIMSFLCCPAIMFLELAHYKFWLLCYVVCYCVLHCLMPCYDIAVGHVLYAIIP